MSRSFFRTKLHCLINIPKILIPHYFEFDRNFVFDGEQHNFWEFIYVDKGKVEIISGDETLVLEQGEIAFHEPNEFHAVKSFESAPNFFVCTFECDSPAMAYFKKFRTVLDKELKPFITSVISETRKAYIIPKNCVYLDRLRKKKNAPIGSEQMIKTLLEQLFILLIRKIHNKKEPSIFPSKITSENNLSTVIKEYVQMNISNTIRVSELCQNFGYSKTYLSKVFKEQSGYTISEFIGLSKIDKAKEMIREHTMNFAEISNLLAFDNPQYFSRVFKRVSGMTPTEFKDSLFVEN